MRIATEMLAATGELTEAASATEPAKPTPQWVVVQEGSSMEGQLIAQIADEGDVVILGRGSQYILDDHPDAYHILLINDAANRAKFMMEHYELSQSKAEQVVNREDKRRMNLYRKLGKSDYDDASLYHLVLNMQALDFDLDKAAAAVKALL